MRAKRIDLVDEHWTVIPVAGDEERAIKLFEAHNGARYDWLGVMGFVLRPLAGKRRRWFCSEICAAALAIDDPWRFDPCSLAAALGALHLRG